MANSIGEFAYYPEERIIFAAYFLQMFLEKDAQSGWKQKKYVSYFKNWTQQAMTDITITFHLGSWAKFYLMKPCKF